MLFKIFEKYIIHDCIPNILQVEQRDVPGIDNAFLAMDTEEGVEVVWNEVQFSGNRNLKEQQVNRHYTYVSCVLILKRRDAFHRNEMIECPFICESFHV